MTALLHDPRVAPTLLVLAIWLTAWASCLVALRVFGGARKVQSLPSITVPALGLWIAWVWIR